MVVREKVENRNGKTESLEGGRGLATGGRGERTQIVTGEAQTRPRRPRKVKQRTRSA